MAPPQPAIPANTLLGRTGIGPGPAEAIPFANVRNLFATTLGAGPYVFITDFGAVCNGVTDDTAAINACFASVAGTGATVVWGAGFSKVTSTIFVGPHDNGSTDSFINIICPHGAVTSGIKWFGATNGTAIAFCRNKYFRVVGLGVFNTVALGTTIGIALGGSGAGSGTATLGGTFDGCLVQGFATGIVAGANSGASSEMTFNNLVLQTNDVGFTTTDFNSLDFVFDMPSMASNGVGLDTGSASGFAVFGGSASGSTVADFKIQANSTQTYIGGGYRSETAVAVVFGSGSGGDVVIDKVLSVGSAAPNNNVTGTFRNLILRDCALDGNIVPASVQVLEITGCALARWDTTRGLPAILTNIPTDVRARGYFRGNVDTGAFPERRIFDHQGMFTARSGVAYYEPVTTLISPDKTSTTDFGLDYLALSHVRHLGEGTIPGATAGTTPATGKNLRVQGTFATSNSLAFTFKRNLTVTSTGVALVTATVGTFKPTDVGKPIKITAGADTGADWYGYITNYLSTTTVNVFPSPTSPGGRFPLSVTKATVVGEDEPDTNYFVVGLAGSANETFWVDTIATTGFTMHSSNATSTATLNALIVR